MGDFNIHINKDSNGIANILLNSMIALGLHCSYSSLYTKKEIVWTLFLLNPLRISWSQPADQLPTSLIIKLWQEISASQKMMSPGKRSHTGKLKLINYTDLAEEMHLDSLLLENLEYKDLVRKLKGNMRQALNIIAPEITKTITFRYQNPWFIEELGAQMKIVRRRETICKKYGQHYQWLVLRGERTKYKQMLRNSWEEKLSNKVLEARCNTKQTV